MSVKLFDLRDTHGGRPSRQRVGRGPGSGRGKTCGRGHKGDKSRSGYKRRAGKEGGQLPLFQKLPGRGFSNMRFRKPVFSINLGRIDAHFSDGETVNRATLLQKGFRVRRRTRCIKILGMGELTKKVTIEATAFSRGAVKKSEEGNIVFKKVRC
ncbi:MAG: 50S ribosomal protein L15 [Simkaniaceae bacterium]|nr:50S ribosomal protein L15 [Simkaniaceae bacterium]